MVLLPCVALIVGVPGDTTVMPWYVTGPPAVASGATGIPVQDAPAATFGDATVPGTVPLDEPTRTAADARAPPRSPKLGDDYSYVIPALEILGFEAGLNAFDRAVVDEDVYGVTWPTTKHNLTHGWEFDTDPFATNQLHHPYSGALFYGFARSAGLSFGESLAYTLGGSLLWEYAGETGPPSVNDAISTTAGGSFLGEALYRMAHLVLGNGEERPGFWRELGAAVISPPTGFNRNAFCGRFRDAFPGHEPALFSRLRLGASLTTRLSDNSSSESVDRKEVVGDLALSYGLPGKPGYTYDRPFDYFHFELTASSSPNSTFENIMTRGLLLGTSYEAGSDYRGVWGLYGSYDYISPEVFRVSTTALSLGSTGQWWMSRGVALQGTVLGGIGFGASGTIAEVGERDYHYGTIPQALLALRLSFGDSAMLDLTAREYYVTGAGIDDRHGHENILRGQASFTVRVFGRHALGIQYVASDRDAYYGGIPDRHQTMGTFSLVYNFLGDPRFGAVEWRNLEER